MSEKASENAETIPTDLKPLSKANSTSEEDTAIINQLSLQLLEETQKSSDIETNLLNFKKQVQDLKRQLIESRKAKEESDKEVEKLSYEMEELSATLFDEANEKVKEANIQANDYIVRNEKLIDTLKEKDITIELLNNELKNLKDMIGDLEEENKKYLKGSLLDQNVVLPDALFRSQILEKFNNQALYSPTYNQLRMDLHYFTEFKRVLLTPSPQINFKESTFYRTLVTEEIEPVLRLDLSPVIKFYQKKSFIYNLLENKVTIEPLSASTEIWKSAQIPQSTTPSAPSSPAISVPTNDKDANKEKIDLRMFRYDTNQPVAVESKCSVCGEAKKEMNFARLYKMKIKDFEYLLCISCSLKLRRIVDLFSYLKRLQPTKSQEQIIKHWFEVVELRARLFYAKLGIWDDSDEHGLVYGWKNSWIGTSPLASFPTTDSTDNVAQNGKVPDSRATAEDEEADETEFIGTEIRLEENEPIIAEDEEADEPELIGTEIKLEENEPIIVEEKHDAERDEPVTSLKSQKSVDVLGDYLENYSKASSDEDEFNDAEEGEHPDNKHE